VAALTASFAAGSAPAAGASDVGGAATATSAEAEAGSLEAGAEFAEFPAHARAHANDPTAQRDDLCNMILSSFIEPR